MRSLATVSLVFALGMTLLRITSAEPATMPAPATQARALETVRFGLDRAVRIGSADLIPKQALRGASVDQALLVHDPITLVPVYGLVPIRAADGRLVGLVGVTADGDKCLWYNFHCPYDRFPPVSAAQSRQRLAGLISDPSLEAALDEPVIISGSDRHLYWRFSAGPSRSWLVNATLPSAPVLSSFDGSDSKALTPGRPLERQAPNEPIVPGKLGDTDPQADMLAATIPACYNIPGIPYHFQITDWFCGPSSLQMIMDYYGQEIGQFDISDVADDVVGSGCNRTNMVRAAHFSGMSAAIQNPTLQGYTERKLGYACLDGNFFTSQASRLKNTVLAQYPVFVLTWFDGAHFAGHYRVVKGYDDSLGVFIMHDPWYYSALCGPDLLIDQAYFVNDLWAYSSCWCMVARPWVLTPSLPGSITQGDTFSVELQVYYPGPTRFKALNLCTNCEASIDLSPGLALAGGTPTVALPDVDSDDTVRVAWDVVAVGPLGEWKMAFQAQGLLQGSSQSYPSYSDTIGGEAYEDVTVIDGALVGWGDEERLTSGAASSETCYPGARALVAGDDGTVHLVWADTRDANGEIYYRRRVGGVWDPEVRLTNDPFFSHDPCIARGPDGSLHVAWVDDRDNNREIYYKRWDPIGGWSAGERVTYYDEVDCWPSIAAGNGQVYLAWERRLGGSYRVAAVQFSTRSGAGWSAPVDVDASAARDSYRPSLAVAPDGVVHLAYERQTSDIPDEHEQIVHRSWNGTTWSVATGLSSDASFSRSPAVAVGDDSKVHVVWQDGENVSGDIFYTCFDGALWQPVEQIVTGSTEASTPSVSAAQSGKVHVVWVDNRHGESEVYLISKGDTGWDNETRLTRSPGASLLPAVTCDNGHGIYVAWTDLRSGDADVYFRGGEDVASVPGMDDGGRDKGAVWLSAARPTPFTSEARLVLSLARDSYVRVEVFDVQGRSVKTLLDGNRAAGTLDLVWNGKTASGAAAAPGLYFVACRSPLGEPVRRVLLVK
jgi:hypothetical protein